jgi:hypothetical protein
MREFGRSGPPRHTLKVLKVQISITILARNQHRGERPAYRIVAHEELIEQHPMKRRRIAG